MRLLAIDPGTTESAWVVWDGDKIIAFDKRPNDEVVRMIRQHGPIAGMWVAHCCIEMVASFGMAVGQEVFETVYWIGRFAEAFGDEDVTRLTRNIIKNHLCHSSRAKDANIRQAIIDRLGPVGKKKTPGPCFGISGDEWSALAVAITFWDKYVTGGQLFERQA